MKVLNYLILVVLLGLISCNQPEKPSETTSHYFEFHNHYWINLHHFLYEKAAGHQLKKMQEDHRSFVDVGESQALTNLSPSEKATLDLAVTYYQDHLINQGLRRELGHLRIWFQAQPEDQILVDTMHGAIYTQVLNQVSPVYRKYFWKLHHSHNLLVLNQHLKTILALEKEVIGKMELLSVKPWPDSTRVRVDLTAYANWAGAYTSSRPSMNIVISSLDPMNTNNSFIETVFHEGSHLLYLFDDSPMRDKIYDEYQRQGMEFRGHLWHAVLFYLCGRCTQDALANIDIQHDMSMEVRNIFPQYNTPKFQMAVEDYYQGKTNVDTMVTRIVRNIDRSH